VNVSNSIDEKEYNERWVTASWSEEKNKENFKSTIDIFSEERPGLIADVSILLNNMHIPIHSLIAKETKDGGTRIQIAISTSDVTQLSNIIDNIRKITGVTQIKRLIK
ncbi:MAG: ACT domain-containing protein, partial [Oscillospiraceae bacterium]